MNDNAAILEFENREAFRIWLEKNYSSSEGIWIVFYKGVKYFTASDALEEAICFGWIDGIMKSIDTTKYKKYFSQRKDKSNWSKKNKEVFKRLKEEGLMTKYGIGAYQIGHEKNETIEKSEKDSINISIVKDVLRNDNDMLKLFENTSLSRQKQLAGFYCEAKSDGTRERRKIRIIEALKTGYKGMLY